MKKKMIIYMSKMSVGGMERSLLNLLEQSNYKKNYDVTVYMLYSKEKDYLDKLKKLVNVKLLWKYKWNLFGKIICAIRMFFDLFKVLLFKNKWDVSICYPYQHPILAKLSLKSSNNSIIFIHSNLELKYKENLLKHCKKMKFNNFSKVVCVSNDAANSFNKISPNYKGEVIVINNYINGKDIISKSFQPISDLYIDDDIVTFINISRHEEQSKRISRIINATNKLKKENYKFKVVLVGDGKDHHYYKNLIHELNLENEVLLLGNKINPYPYLKNADCFVFSSYFEGYGMVLDEARVLGKPIITTDVADAKLMTNDGYGILCDNSEDGIYIGMKKYLDDGFNLKTKFDYKKFNNNITNLLDEIVK